MTIPTMVSLGEHALQIAMMCAGPLLVTALLVGTFVSIIQSITQVQEMTLVFVPKMVAVFGVMWIGGGWMIKMVVSFGITTFKMIPQVLY